jgi:hypothetical protein
LTRLSSGFPDKPLESRLQPVNHGNLLKPHPLKAELQLTGDTLWDTATSKASSLFVDSSKWVSLLIRGQDPGGSTMKTIGLLVSVTLLAAVSSGASDPDAARDVDGAPASLTGVCEGEETPRRLPPALGGKPLGDNGVTIAPLEQPRQFRAYRDYRGPDYKILIVHPRQDVDYKIVRIQPDPNVDYKIRNFDPGGREAHAAPQAHGRRSILIAPKPSGARK